MCTPIICLRRSRSAGCAFLPPPKAALPASYSCCSLVGADPSPLIAAQRGASVWKLALCLTVCGLFEGVLRTQNVLLPSICTEPCIMCVDTEKRITLMHGVSYLVCPKLTPSWLAQTCEKPGWPFHKVQGANRKLMRSAGGSTS